MPSCPRPRALVPRPHHQGAHHALALEAPTPQPAPAPTVKRLRRRALTRGARHPQARHQTVQEPRSRSLPSLGDRVRRGPTMSLDLQAPPRVRPAFASVHTPSWKLPASQRTNHIAAGPRARKCIVVVSAFASVPERSLGRQTARATAHRPAILGGCAPLLKWAAALVQACGRGNDPSNTGERTTINRHSTSPTRPPRHGTPPANGTGGTRFITTQITPHGSDSIDRRL